MIEPYKVGTEVIKMIEPYKVGTEVIFKSNDPLLPDSRLRGIIIENYSSYRDNYVPRYKIKVYDYANGTKVFDSIPHYCIHTVIERRLNNTNTFYTKAVEAIKQYGCTKSTFKNDLIPLRIIYNDPATIVFWNDQTKTVVKRMKDEPFNPYTAFCAALAKKVYGNNSQVNNIVKKGAMQKKQDTVLKEKSKKDKKAKGAKKNGSSK